MHDCPATKARLVDLIFGEAADAEPLRAEVRSCAACAAEHRALSETLRAFDRAADGARPAEEFWPQYHARLARRIDAAGPAFSPASGDPALGDHSRARPSSPLAWLRRALAARWSVPAPVALAALLLIACLSAFALRSPSAAVAPPRESDAAPAAHEPQPVRTIEVPVVHERIVTRTVYVTRPARKRAGATASNDARLIAGSSPATSSALAPGRDTLTGFQPADDVKLRVIKGSFANEK